MTVEAYVLNWNEEFLHLTIKHYQQFCDRITIYDNYSDDGSDQVARDMGCEVVKFGIKGQLSDAHYLKVKNTAWKNSTADWVIVCDADEILWHHDLKNVLQKATDNGHTIFDTRGINVYSEATPSKTYLEVTTGLPDGNYSKKIIFNPRHIKDIRYSYGAHTCHPIGLVETAEHPLWLLHYRCIGGVDRIVKRHGMYRKRMSPDNIRFGLGIHYQQEDERRIREWHESYANCREFSELGILL
jgi:glycosyltransferase involved in cell wall biosynthesis